MTGVVVDRPVPTVEDLERWIAARELQHVEFLARAAVWGAERGDPVLTWPRDQAAVLALGVPCDDCVTVVRELEPVGGPRHVLRVTGYAGRHWAAGIVARCGRPPVVVA